MQYFVSQVLCNSYNTLSHATREKQAQNVPSLLLWDCYLSLWVEYIALHAYLSASYVRHHVNVSFIPSLAPGI